jgi:hypothetical protein
MIFNRAFLIFFILSSYFLNAQPANSASGPGIRFVITAPLDVKGMSWSVGSGPETSFGGISQGYPSVLFPVVDKGTIRFFKPIPAQSSGQNKVTDTERLLAECSWPQGSSVVLAALVPVPSTVGDRKLPYTLVAYTDDADIFKAGYIRLFNFTSAPIALKCGSTELLVTAFSAKTFDSFRNKKYLVPLQLAYKVNDGWVSIPTPIYSLQNECRMYIFVNYGVTPIATGPSGPLKASAPRIFLTDEIEYWPTRN